jgi:glycosyltransferase involved in cell wall biosynthesis
MNKDLHIITNESIFFEDGKYYCDNIDLKSIPEALNEQRNISIIGRKSKKRRSKKIDIKNIKINSNIFFYVYSIIKSLFKQKNKYLIISISPYTFVASIILKIFNKNQFVYLRSDGYKEYRSIFGIVGPAIYHFMFLIVSKTSSLISCRKHILRGKSGHIVHPSQLNEKWFAKVKQENFDKNKLLYVGRLRVEKGIFSLLKLIKNTNIKLTAVTSEKENDIDLNSQNISVINFENYNDAIIKFYDNHGIFILPSYTEGHPQVLDEALARFRPVIVFEEISHVARNRKGVFISKRKIDSLKETIDHIIKNYELIKEDIKKNILPTKKNFIEELKTIVFKN